MTPIFPSSTRLRTSVGAIAVVIALNYSLSTTLRGTGIREGTRASRIYSLTMMRFTPGDSTRYCRERRFGNKISLKGSLKRSEIIRPCMASRKDRMSDSMSGSPSFEYTHLEVNAQLWKFAPSHGTKETSILVDPLIGALDFGLPDGVYSAGPAVLRNTEALVKQIVDSQPKAILITQSLDDHLHPPTLKLLKEKIKVPFIVIGPPSARERLRGIFDSKNIRVLPPGKSVNVKDLTVTATRGSLVGPPWQAPENGYVVTWDGPSVYYEPHNDVDVRTKLKGITADIVIAPMKSQKLPFFTLVYGKDRALQLASHLKHSCTMQWTGSGPRTEMCLVPDSSAKR